MLSGPLASEGRASATGLAEEGRASASAVASREAGETTDSALPLLLAATWFAGIVGLVGFWVASYFRFARRLPAGRCDEEGWDRQWQELLIRQGIRRRIPLQVTTYYGPYLCYLRWGYRLLVPAELWGRLSPAGRMSILQHELAHFQRGDLWKSLLVRLLMLPHWFNPFAWWAVRRFDDAAEWACDEAGRGVSHETVREYAKALLQLNETVHAHLWHHPAAWGRGLSARIQRSCFMS